MDDLDRLPYHSSIPLPAAFTVAKGVFMKKVITSLLILTSLGWLAACAQQTDSNDLKTTEHATAEAQSAAKASSDKSADSAAKHYNGGTWQATDDHIVSAEKAASAVKATVKSASRLQIIAVPNINRDSQGHHYYQVDSYRSTKNGKHPLVETYFVYPDGQITTRQIN